jgi:hypothetical protein
MRDWQEVSGGLVVDQEPEPCQVAHCRLTLVVVSVQDSSGRTVRSVQCPRHGDVRVEREG